MSRTQTRGLLITAVALALSGCGDLLQEPDTGTDPLPVQIQAVSGDDQVGTAGTALAQPLRVQLVDPEGRPLRGLWIQWTAFGGSGTASPRNGFTDENGVAETTWILGPASGLQHVQVDIPGGTPMIFDATAAGS